MDEKSVPPRSHTFVIRVWLEEMGDGRVEWRGQVRHVQSEQMEYFREWPGLMAQLQAMLPR